MNEAQTKIQKSSKRLFYVTAAITLFLFVGIIVFAANIVLLGNAETETFIRLPIQTGMFYSIPAINEGTMFGASLNAVRAVLGKALLYEMFWCAIFFLITSIFKKVSEDLTPFTNYVSKRLKWIAFSFVLMTVLSPFYEMIMVSWFFGWENRLEYAYSVGYIVFKMDWIAGFILFGGLAKMFEYGTDLQKEADETL